MLPTTAEEWRGADRPEPSPASAEGARSEAEPNEEQSGAPPARRRRLLTRRVRLRFVGIQRALGLHFSDLVAPPGRCPSPLRGGPRVRDPLQPAPAPAGLPRGLSGCVMERGHSEP